MIENEIYRTFRVTHDGNSSKTQLLVDLLPLWRNGLTLVRDVQIKNLKDGIKIGWVDTKELPDYLTARQWKNVNNQANNDLKSWAAKIAKQMKPLIHKLDVDEEEKKRLFKINKTYLWSTDPVLKKLAWRLKTVNEIPVYDNCNTMLMDNLIAQIEQSETSRYDKWIRISTKNHKPVRIPIKHNPYYKTQPGKNVLTQITVINDIVKIGIVKKQLSQQSLPETPNIMGLDWGLKNLITTSDGEQHGKQLFEWLKHKDKQLIQLQKNLNKNGIKKLNQSKRYRKLNQRINSYVENEIGRIINKFTQKQLTEIVIEDLDFRGGGGLSRQLNRIITRAGRKVLMKRLNELSQTHGVTITKVNPAYTSQQCSSCGYSDPRNRKTQKQFNCKHCNLKLNADVNAARAIKHRRSMSNLTVKTSRVNILAEIDRQFETRWGIEPTKLREQKKRRNSPATPKTTSRLTQKIQSNAIQ